MVNRHVVTKQRAPSTKEVIRRIEELLAVETAEKGKAQLEHALAYWKTPKKERK